ncbi:MAG: class I SAM-dependent methyltransferase [Candidatus Bathyarchaeota archaeon]|nr:MAG: class I SAM-dependent methyltransferase [Candidatus Bathyarchaeota archaeon]
MTPTKPLAVEEDTYGQEIMAFHQGRKVSEVVERDDGYIEDSMSLSTYFSNYDDWAPKEQQAISFVQGRVLDIGCGAGRHALYLQKQGFTVLGIDISPLAIEVCRQKGLKNTEVTSIEDVAFPPDSFDTILMMGNNFGLFGNFEKARKLLNRFYTMTSEEALIIASSRDPYQTENSAHLQYHAHNKKNGRMGGQVRIRIRFGENIGRWFDYLLVSQAEMKEILSDTGWKVKQLLETENPDYFAIIEKAS